MGNEFSVTITITCSKCGTVLDSDVESDNVYNKNLPTECWKCDKIADLENRA